MQPDLPTRLRSIASTIESTIYTNATERRRIIAAAAPELRDLADETEGDTSP